MKNACRRRVTQTIVYTFAANCVSAGVIVVSDRLWFERTYRWLRQTVQPNVKASTSPSYESAVALHIASRLEIFLFAA